MTDRSNNDTDAIAAILASAEAGVAPPQVRPGLAERVRSFAIRRRRQRRWAAGSAMAVAVTIGAVVALQPRRPGPTPRPDAARLAAELQQAQTEAAERFAVARRVIALERSRQQVATATVAAPSPVLFSDRAQAAVTLVSQADRLRDRLARPDDALAAYRRAAELFPDTPSAAVARQRIRQLEAQPKT
jgi:hypothetical protein